MSEETLYQEILRVKATVKDEIVVGGSLTDLPCPFCRLPRCERTDYVRCSKCGINWMTGEDYSRDPKIERFAKMVSGQPKVKVKE